MNNEAQELFTTKLKNIFPLYYILEKDVIDRYGSKGPKKILVADKKAMIKKIHDLDVHRCEELYILIRIYQNISQDQRISVKNNIYSYTCTPANCLPYSSTITSNGLRFQINSFPIKLQAMILVFLEKVDDVISHPN